MIIRKFSYIFLTALFGILMTFSPVLAKGGNEKGNNGNNDGNGDMDRLQTRTELHVSDYPPGILHAPGIQKRIDDGRGLPYGVDKRFDIDDINENDTTAPEILYINTYEIEDCCVHIVWVTNEYANSKIWLSTDMNVDTSTTPTISSDLLKYFHNFPVHNLEPDTTYYFKVSSTDASGNEVFSTEASFTTPQ